MYSSIRSTVRGSRIDFVSMSTSSRVGQECPTHRNSPGTKNMKSFIVAILLVSSVAAALPVRSFCEERCKDDDLALFDPQRQELICRMGAAGPWGFCFAGFETETRRPIELQVSGSG